ncbi:hypothetical protein ACIODS_27305 [Micromonospora chalcea]|uniref:hypothetical protein n=1 Tax=Micromonospora chalcea TaxID=1874 RepID=UPI0037F1FE3B
MQTTRSRRRLSRSFAGALAAAASLCAAFVVPPAPANAATTGYVYLVTPKWWGWCPGSNNAITWVGWVNSSISSGGDSGDDIVYAKVNLNVSQTVVMTVQCSRSTPQGASASIKPTRTGQTFFMGYPSGSYTDG